MSVRFQLTEKIRLRGIAIVALMGVSCTNDAPNRDSSNMPEEEGSRPVELTYFERTPMPDTGPVPTFNQVAMSGTLSIRNGCVVLDAAERSFALAFEKGSADYDPSSRSLRVGRMDLVDGDRVTMGGSGGSAVASLSEPDAAARCGTDDIWVVNPGSLSKQD